MLIDHNFSLHPQTWYNTQANNAFTCINVWCEYFGVTGAPPAMTRAGDRYSAGCFLKRCRQYATRHGMRCARRPPPNIHTVCVFRMIIMIRTE
ncbi:hypothetical protein Y032_0206g1973 [Ancylostoma ceylanicum]|uniref:Uncharacterized protein n=1 Tax=Ancylostoma ceylanicum TaxID=53326 RepID=A0A016SL73_9BILA|nr:hypothetical protein Y032_0206g1973 [Ancylostoma ceylanicum]